MLRREGSLSYEFTVSAPQSLGETPRQPRTPRGPPAFTDPPPDCERPAPRHSARGCTASSCERPSGRATLARGGCRRRPPALAHLVQQARRAQRRRRGAGRGMARGIRGHGRDSIDTVVLYSMEPQVKRGRRAGRRGGELIRQKRRYPANYQLRAPTAMILDPEVSSWLSLILFLGWTSRYRYWLDLAAHAHRRRVALPLASSRLESKSKSGSPECGLGLVRGVARGGDSNFNST